MHWVDNDYLKAQLIFVFFYYLKLTFGRFNVTQQASWPPLHSNSNAAIDTAVDAIAKQMEILILEVRSLNPKLRATPSLTPGHFGWEEMKRLEEAEKIQEYPGVPELPSILDETDIEELEKLKKENHIVAFFTPILEKVFKDKDGYSIVNSEEYGWLETCE